MSTRKNCVRGLAAVLMLLSVPVSLSAERRAADKERAGQPSETVELFAAMDSGQIDVKLVAKNERKAHVRIKNNTDRPLSVRLPDAFAGVPALAQFLPRPDVRNRAVNNRPNANQNRNQQAQTLGGNMNIFGQGQNNGPFGNMQNMFNGPNPFNGPGRGQQGNGVFNVPPESEKSFQVETVCLEHGKRTPRLNSSYEIVRIDTVTTDPTLRELLKVLGPKRGRANHQAAQAAAWHLANQMSWETLAKKRRGHLNGTSQPYFTANEIQTAKELVDWATAQGSQPSAQPSTESVSQAP